MNILKQVTRMEMLYPKEPLPSDVRKSISTIHESLARHDTTKLLGLVPEKPNRGSRMCIHFFTLSL